MELPITERRKNYKKNRILNIIRYSDAEISRFDIKKITEYSMTTVLNIVEELLSDKLIYENEPDMTHGRVGRRPTYLSLNPQGGYFIGLEFNIQKMYYTILNFSGKVIYSNFLLLKNNITAKQILSNIYSCINECMDFLGSERSKCLGIGIGLPGYIDSEKGVALHYAYLKDWNHIPITQQIEKLYHLPCHILNNSDCMVLAYKWLEFRGNSEDFVFISIRTGARAIPVLNNQPFFGKNGTAGELGHLPVSGNTKKCFCGKIGCLNTIISDFSIQQHLKEQTSQGKFKALIDLAQQNPENLNSALLVHSALNGDLEAISYLQELAFFLGHALIPVVNLFAPQKIILSGELSKSGQIITAPLLKTIQNGAVKANVNQLQILRSVYDDNIGAIGAAMLVLQKKYDITSTII
ncbi:ROK family protein [Clostridiales bacterium COT073_COT-073]|nr:ROK family protein [Clostridiales bacterium COT073_COT-073]